VLALAATSDHASLDTTSGLMRVTSGKSRVRESRPPGSVRAKAEWLSYSTMIVRGNGVNPYGRFELDMDTRLDLN
jgi:hypothetical protein